MTTGCKALVAAPAARGDHRADGEHRRLHAPRRVARPCARRRRRTATSRSGSGPSSSRRTSSTRTARGRRARGRRRASRAARSTGFDWSGRARPRRRRARRLYPGRPPRRARRSPPVEVEPGAASRSTSTGSACSLSHVAQAETCASSSTGTGPSPRRTASTSCCSSSATRRSTTPPRTSSAASSRCTRSSRSSSRASARRSPRSSTGCARTCASAPGFGEFARRHDPLVVSSGFHELIEPLLEREGLELDVVANRLDPRPDGWRVVFRDGATCAVCGEPCKRGGRRRARRVRLRRRRLLRPLRRARGLARLRTRRARAYLDAKGMASSRSTTSTTSRALSP